ncbi:MAG: PfkB family carbohydrate kinase [Nostoc sp.]|uniref:PfkB family carbohydrate kinase n=1 Tax=Nostoc sp. TaxID=1180 RepID=UPI002FF71570
MWLIPVKAFTNPQDEIEVARAHLQDARQNNTLTIVIGNSLTRFSYLLKAHQCSENKKYVGWERAIQRILPKLTPIANELPFDNINYDLDPFVIVRSSCVTSQGKSQKEKRQEVLEEIKKELLPYTNPCPLHKFLVDLNPKSVITTNYDLQIERAFAQKTSQWEALVKDAHRINSNNTPIYKINGSLEPDENLKEHYSFPSNVSTAEETILISIDDYERAFSEVSLQNSAILEDIGQTLLIIGKSMSSLDVLFIKALELSLSTKNRQAYYLSFGENGGLSLDDRRNLENLKINSLHINMPESLQNEHYYVSTAYALMDLFPDLADTYRSAIENFANEQKLIQSPRLVGIGLAAHNTIGRLRYLGGAGEEVTRNKTYMLPTAGRRNLRLDAEEYPGGASLTALKTFTSLDTDQALDASMISIVNGQDLFGKEILDFCKKSRIDADGISRKAEYSWHSTVLVHDGEYHNGIYPGQRIFLDRGFDNLELEPASIEQLEAQLHPEQKNLRIIYFDKFLAQPYGTNHQGALSQHKSIFDNLVATRPDVDIVYETGGGGSKGSVVEAQFSPYINIITASFPFFARFILPDSFNLPNSNEEFLLQNTQALKDFTNDEFFKIEFEQETQAIEELIKKLNISSGEDFETPDEWIKGGDKWIKRQNCHRRWVIATMHQYGALAIDLDRGFSFYYKSSSESKIESTVGAGDVFRGAFCYALAKLADKFQGTNQQRKLIKICTQFSVEIASEKCRYLKMTEAFEYIRKISDSTLNKLLAN